MPYFALIIMFYHVKVACYQWRDADMWRHHGSRHGPMQAHVGAYMARRNRAMCNGPTGIVGQGVR